MEPTNSNQCQRIINSNNSIAKYEPVVEDDPLSQTSNRIRLPSISHVSNVHRSKKRIVCKSKRPGRYKCPNSGCERIYNNRDGLQKHRRYECQKDPGFMCPYCGLKMARGGNVRRHVKRVHKGHEVRIIELDYVSNSVSSNRPMEWLSWFRDLIDFTRAD